MAAADALTETISSANALNSANVDVHVHDRRRVQASGTVEVAFKVVMPTAPGAAEATSTSVVNDLTAAASAIATAGTLSSLGSFDDSTFVAPELADSTTVKAADSCQGDHILLTSTGEV